MNKLLFVISMFVIIICSWAFKTDLSGGSITGRVMPAEGVLRIWALSAKDTLRGNFSGNGAFEIANAEPGVYTVVVEAKSPFKALAKDNVVVDDGKSTDLGEIRLEQ